MKKSCEIAIVGRACRLPGAKSVSSLWTLLQDQTCAITQVPSDRWSLERFGHPRQGERGRSYTWAAGVLDDIWGFDAGAFGLSPREADQMDPQQRLLLELTWEALEDAGIPPSSLAGTETGVFVGASTADYGNSKMFDLASADGYFATGNAASILANRISYIYDLNGPSFTVDTACSSSMVALDAAVQALQAGRIETAVVGGVSILAAPFQFINFSQASMLSRTGLCQAFSAAADGYVRSEGGGVLVLRTQGSLRPGRDRVHATVVGTRINSDGRTNGIALPSKQRQALLLEQLYGEYGVDPESLAFVEAHGTGTPVGDPIEAAALGEVLGRGRTAPLPIGSVKSNIGHTEAAAGVAGIIKATLALEHDLLPATLHVDALNPNIDFERLNLTVATAPVRLERTGAPRLAGVSSYGFGGTNSHVILAGPPSPQPAVAAPEPPRLLVLSAHSRAALGALAGRYADVLDGTAETERDALAAAANHRRDLLPERLVLPVERGADLPAALRAFAEGGAEACPAAVAGTASGRDPRVAFVYAGNGSQWVGMGRTAYRDNPDFRARFDEVDRLFRPLSGWSLADMMTGDTLADQIAKTSVAQPLIFAIQAATTRALDRLGLKPDLVMGHSVGEVAAAEAAGVLDLPDAVKVIHYRSHHQELTFDRGGMAVVIGPREVAQKLAAEIPNLSVAAYNSPRATTLSGTADALHQLGEQARRLKVRVQKLDIRYPFHSALIDAIEGPLLDDLASLSPHAGRATFVSTVTGTVLPGEALDPGYWWRNVREPVLFAQGVEAAAREGARVFVEVGPNPILLSNINDVLAANDVTGSALAVHDRKAKLVDPFRTAVAGALARGARVTADAVLGTDPGPVADLPAYPWQKKRFRLGDTPEAVGYLVARPWHPLVGARFAPDALEWHSVVDTALEPVLADHVVDGHVLLPGAAFAEMALAVARDWLGTETAAVADFEIHQPMILAGSASRDVRCRVQPVTGTLEIMSRPRFGQANWQVHAVAKLLRFTGDPEPVPAWTPRPDMPAVSGAVLYPMAARSGLQYGPAFQLLETAYRAGPDAIVVDLVPGEGDPRYGFDPARVDACFHGLVLLFADLAAQGRLKPYVPVAVGDIKLFRPGAAVARAAIRVLRSDERTIVLDFTLLDPDNRAVAVLHRARFQAMNAFRAAERPISLIARTTILATEPLAVPVEPSISSLQVVQAAQAADLLGKGEPSPDYVLLEGWATAVAFGLFETLARNGVVALDQLVAEGRMPENLMAWCDRLLTGLERSGLVRKGRAGLELVADHDLPDPRDILNVLASEHPDRSAELLLAARTEALVDAIAAGTIEHQPPVTQTAIEAYDFGSPAAVASARALAGVLDRLGDAWPGDRALRILQVGDGPLSPLVARLAASRTADFTLFEPDRRRLERARLSLGEGGRVSFAGSLDDVAAGTVDLVLASHGLHRLPDDPTSWGKLADAMASNAVLIALEPEASVFRDLVFGLQAALAADGAVQHGGAVASEAGWTRVLNGMNLGGAAVRTTVGTDFALLCTGQRSTARHARPLKGEALVICDDGPLGEAAAALATMLKFSGLKVASLHEPRLFEAAPVEVPETLVYLAQGASAPGSADRIAERCLRIKALATLIGTRKTTLWILCPGATRMDRDGGDAAQAAVWAFARTLANENHAIDLRLVDLAPDLPADVAARRLRDAILSGTAEREIILDASSTRIVRFEPVTLPDATAVPPDERVMRLVKGEGAGLDRLAWQVEQRRAPGPGEIEIAVEAAGLNFRDVMWGLSILPEEILEDGYAGATLGLECAGRVVRIGPGVERLGVGDRVLAFAKAALATHVTVAAAVAAPIPDALAAAAAATVPVAFLTAYYALIRCARLAEEEWVLIHGGAGGVGLAAIQIARWRGARIIATAGSAERRDLLRVLGAEHVFDSRSTQFVEDVRRVTGAGVDVVLNSLSGEAMERSITVLKPFGRFVELGKRDYVANTHIGLKPFRRNLSYFGVDLDQLIVKSETVGQDLFTDVMGLFADGSLAALPYRTFEAAEVVDAFRVMQRSGHVGKIVIAPPALPARDGRGAPVFAASPDRTHLITGGLGGFGLATARWLADRGARHLVLAGRSGAATEEAREAVAALRADGIAVEVASLDVADEAAVAALLARIGRTMPRLGGVIHAATVFDDAIVANLTEARLRPVLAAKATGAAILDRLTRGMPLDYFILYSSATTLIGNPGQGAYVAANAYLEALAQGRRRDGLPGFAVAWGAIEDVGILARSGSTAAGLLARSGVLGMAARTALDHLGEVLARAGDLPDPAVLAVASVNWSAAREHLPVLRWPSFGDLMRDAQGSEGSETSKIAVRALVEQIGVEAATRKIADTVQDEIARILRLPREDVSRTKPLMEIGLDSLMAVELGMALEERFTLEAPLSTSAGVMTVTELADYVVGLASEPGSADPVLGSVSMRHLDAETRKELAQAMPDLAQDQEPSRRETVH